MWDVIYTSNRMIEILIRLMIFQFEGNHFYITYTFSFGTSNMSGAGVASWQWSQEQLFTDLWLQCSSTYNTAKTSTMWMSAIAG